MFQNLFTPTLLALVVLGSLVPATAEEPEITGSKKKFDLNKGVKLEMLLISSGEFMMGSPASDKEATGDEKPQHRVRIIKPFYLGKYPVTQEQWQAIMGDNPSAYKGPKNPVANVTWDDCQKCIEKLNTRFTKDKVKFALPTEAQWEYACRAGSTTKWYCGDNEDDLADYAWYQKNAGASTHPVGQKKPNAWGLFDMHGNVWEWCSDGYDWKYYAKSPDGRPDRPRAGFAPRVAVWRK